MIPRGIAVAGKTMAKMLEQSIMSLTLLIMITKIVLIIMMVVTHSDDNDYDNCGDGSLPLFVFGPLEK